MRTLIPILCLLLIGVSSAQPASATLVQHKLVADSLGGGAGTMRSEDFIVDAALGHAVTVGLASGREFVVGSGIWGGGPITTPMMTEVYLPLVTNRSR